MPKATAAQDGYMPKEAFSKLDGIDPGAEVNVNPTQTYTPSASQGVLILTLVVTQLLFLLLRKLKQV